MHLISQLMLFCCERKTLPSSISDEPVFVPASTGDHVGVHVCLLAICEIDSTGETDVIVETRVDGLTSTKGPKSVYTK